MKKNNHFFLSLSVTLFFLWVLMVSLGAVHSFMPVVPALGYWQVVLLNFLVGLVKVLVFGQKKGFNYADK